MATKTKRRSRETGTQTNTELDSIESLERQIRQRNPRPQRREMRITEEMRKVKSFYWAAKQKIEPEDCALHCEIRPQEVAAWFEDQDIKKWFNLKPIRSSQAIEALSQRSLSVLEELLECHEMSVREKAARYLIDQSVGKAKDKQIEATDEDDEDFDIGFAIKELDKLKRKEGKNDK